MKKLNKVEDEILEAVKGCGNMMVETEIDLQEGQEVIRTKALDGASSQGAELAPQQYGTSLYTTMATMDGNLFGRFPKVQMSSNIMNLSELTGKPVVYAYGTYAAGNTAIENATKSTPATDQIQLSAKTFVAKVDIYDHLMEDEKVNLVRNLKNVCAQQLNSAISNTILNGDTEATNDEDVAASAATDVRRMWDGLRKMSMGVAGLNAALTDGGFTLDDLVSLHKLGGKYFLGANIPKSMFIVGVAGYNQMLDKILANTATPVVATAAIKDGIVTNFLGHPVVTSEWQREDLEDDGFYDITGTSIGKGFVTLVNPSEFIIGLRRNITVRVVPDPLNGKSTVIAEMRLDFKPMQTPSATVTSVVGGYGFTA